MENILVIFFIPIIFLAGRYFKLSEVSYTLIAIFFCLHLVGSHYTYADVPFGAVLQHWMGESRNMYDRLVHFSFGLLIAYPMREVFFRIAHARGFWGYYLPIDLVGAFSAIYEIIEWLTAAVVNSEAGLEFLGSQGDIWDAQKDMLAAIIGALITMAIVFIINAFLQRGFWKEIRKSFRLSRDDQPLGEQKLKSYFK